MVTLKVPAGEDTAVVAARGAVREIARGLGFDVVQQTRIATAVSEIVRNVVMYARSGTVTIREHHHNGRIGLMVVVEDEGPGIADVERALQGGYTTSGGFGRGISGARALTDEFHLDSCPGQGTRVTMISWRD